MSIYSKIAIICMISICLALISITYTEIKYTVKCDSLGGLYISGKCLDVTKITEIQLR